jgi:nucleoside-triphosphatase
MARMLLFTGPKRVGKSTAVQRVIAATGKEHFQGFYTRERRDEVRRRGFDIIMLDGRRGSIASDDSDSPIRMGSHINGRLRYGVTLDFLEEVAVPAIDEAASKPRYIFVMDEIGPMQLYSSRFTDAIERLLQADVIVLGSIVERSVEWADKFRQNPGVEVFGLTERNRDTMAEMMTLYLRELLAEPVRATSDGRQEGGGMPMSVEFEVTLDDQVLADALAAEYTTAGALGVSVSSSRTLEMLPQLLITGSCGIAVILSALEWLRSKTRCQVVLDVRGGKVRKSVDCRVRDGRIMVIGEAGTSVDLHEVPPLLDLGSVIAAAMQSGTASTPPSAAVALGEGQDGNGSRV